ESGPGGCMNLVDGSANPWRAALRGGAPLRGVDNHAVCRAAFELKDWRHAMLLQDRVALITAGAGVGIGHAVAARFLEEGANVVITDAHAKRTEETAAELGKQFKREVLGIPVDVTKRDQIEGAVAKTREKYGRVDILFNNAGINKLEPIWQL